MPNNLRETLDSLCSTSPINNTPLLSEENEGKPTNPADMLVEVQQHILAVQGLMNALCTLAKEQVSHHDETKVSYLKDYVKDYTTRGDDNPHWWSVVHSNTERHHLPNTIDDLNLIDVLEYLCDGVAAGLARTHTYKPRPIPPETLQKAVDNTVHLLLTVSKPQPPGGNT